MKVSYNELNNRYFSGTLPAPEVLAEALTFHAWEIEEVSKVGNDTVLDVKVLPDKSAWALSHRGIAKDISAILNKRLLNDPLDEDVTLEPKTREIGVSVVTPTCTRYNAALIRGIKVGPSPVWLVDFLTSMGQRSINNVVDITNYVMFGLGQPLHAFDVNKLQKSPEGQWNITIRDANLNEHITTLTGEKYVLNAGYDALIVDGTNNQAVGIAGIKGGKVAEVDANTTDILLESANFDPVKIRQSSQRLKLRTDASQRYENGVSRGLTSYGIAEASARIAQECGGVLVGYVDTNPKPVERTPVVISYSKINSVLGLSLTHNDIDSIFSQLGFVYSCEGDSYTVTAPFERPDLVIAEDVIEEIGRIHGYDHVVACAIEPIPLREINKRFYYAEKVRELLCGLGFSEVFTSSFRDVDEVKLANALASDKGYLRSALHKNLEEAMRKNAGAVELFGTDKVRIFEIGTVFTHAGEKQSLAFGVSSKAGVTSKDFKEVSNVLHTLTEVLGVVSVIHTVYEKEGIIEIDFDTLIQSVPQPTAYDVYEKSADVTYKPFSNYPHAVRDIAFWTEVTTTEEEAEAVLRTHAGALLQRLDCFDRFEKEGRVSYGFRLVFQSYEKTLTAEEVDAVMASIASAVSAEGWVVR